MGNLKLAIGLLLIISIVISLGTVLEQDKTLSFYKMSYPSTNPIMGFFSFDTILLFGLDHIYKTTWFFLLLFTFGVSLISCTVVRQIPSLKLARIWKFFKKDKGLPLGKGIMLMSNSSLAHFSYLLRENNYNIVQQGSYLHAYRGFIGKVGPIFVHISIICILLGCICSQMTGFMSQEMIQKGDVFYPQNIVSSGDFANVRPDFVSYVKDFKIAYTDWGLIDQFYSDLQIRDKNLDLVSDKTIFVNEPLRHKGLTFYQTEWSIPLLHIRNSSGVTSNIKLKEVNLENAGRFWVGSFKNQKGQEKIVVLEDLTGRYFVYNFKRELLAMQEVGDRLFLDGMDLRVSEIIPSTGIQVKSDPGVVFIYFGFLVLVLSITLSYASYSQIWAMRKDNTLYIYGVTNRGVYFFEQFMLDLVREI
jgi:cytochrome c biogenesis protein